MATPSPRPQGIRSRFESIRAWAHRQRRWALLLAVVLFGVALYGMANDAASVWFVFFPAVGLGLIAALFRWSEYADVIRAGAMPLGWLAIILIPLGLPLIAGVIVGSPAFGRVVQVLLVPALLFISWRAIIKPCGDEIAAAWRRFRRKVNVEGVWRRIGAVVLVVALAIPAALLIAPHVTVFEDRPGTSTVLLTIAFGLWLTAILLRLWGYGFTWLQFPVAVFAMGLVVWGSIWAGILPWADWDWWGWLSHHDWVGKTLLFGFLISLAVAVAAEGISVRWKWLADRLANHPRKDVRGLWPRGGGDLASILAAVLLFVAATWSYVETHDESQNHITDGKAAKTLEVTDPVTTPPAELAKIYAPELVFTEDEDWHPIPVEDYIDDEKSGITGSYVNQHVRDRMAVGKLPKKCPGLETPCYDLTIGCDEPEQCMDSPDFPPGATYVRVLKETDKRKRGPDPFAVPPKIATSNDPRVRKLIPFIDSTAAMVQYWYFYRFNEWTRPTLTGRLAGRHESDWETITVGLSHSEPLWVAYSAHCAGAWRPWSKVEVAKTPNPRTHPLAAVAEGSHANYFESQERRSPDWAGCAGLGEGTTTLLSYASNIRDKTEDGPSWLPSTPAELRIVDQSFDPHERDPGAYINPMTFPGTWGPRTQTLLINRREHKLEDKAGGPKTPTLQKPWRDPLGTIFCTDWQPRVCSGK